MNNTSQEVEIFDSNFKHDQYGMMEPFDGKVQVGYNGSYFLFPAHAITTTIFSGNSKLSSFCVLNACTQSSNQQSFFNTNNTYLIGGDDLANVPDSMQRCLTLNTLCCIVDNIRNMPRNSIYNVIFTNTHCVGVIFVKDYYNQISMVVIDSNGLCIDSDGIVNNLSAIKRFLPINRELVVGTNGIGSGSGYCYAFVKNMLYTLEKNNLANLWWLLHFANQCDPTRQITNNYFTIQNGTLGDYMTAYRGSNNLFMRPTFIRCIQNELARQQPFMQEILKNTVQARANTCGDGKMIIPYLCKYTSKNDNKTKYTNIYLHFSTFAQILSDPFLLRLTSDSYHDFNVNTDENVKKILIITKKYMPKLYQKIMSSIDNQKYIDDFMKHFGYTKDKLMNNFLNNIQRNTTYDMLVAEFNAYIAQIKTKQQLDCNKNMHIAEQQQECTSKQNDNIGIVSNDSIHGLESVNQCIRCDENGCHCFDWW